MEYLGHIISGHGVSTDEHKIQAVKEWPTPKNAKQVRVFLGLAGYYRKFIKNYGMISRPLIDLLKKNTIYHWTVIEQGSFDAIKQALINEPVLALPDFSKQFTIETDACDKGIGAVSMQQEHPIAFLSKALGPKSQILSTYEKECLAILTAIDKWRSYLQHQEFTIRSDQKSLIHLGDQELATSIQHKVFLKLMGLQYKILYKKGVANRAADALSHRPGDAEEVSSLSSSKPRWLEIITAGYLQKAKSKQLLTELTLTGHNEQGYTF